MIYKTYYKVIYEGIHLKSNKYNITFSKYTAKKCKTEIKNNPFVENVS